MIEGEGIQINTLCGTNKVQLFKTLQLFLFDVLFNDF